MPNNKYGDSIRRIKLEQLQVGMYVTEFSDQRAIEAGLKAKGLITREETLARFRRLEVAHVYIDVAKGLDCEGSESVNALKRQQEEELKRVAVEQVCAPKVKFDEEIERARALQNKAHGLVQGIMADVKMGKAFDGAAVDAIASEVVESLNANQNALGSLLRLREMDQYLLEHSTNVAVLMGVIARSMGVVGQDLHEMVFGGFVHDVGKIRVPDEVLHKPGRLDASEWGEMKNHVRYGLESLKGIPGISRKALEICGHHHERLDGTGYPFQLSSDRIGLHARIAAVADVYDAITADRCYHKGMEPTAALKKLIEWSGDHLDRDIVYQLIRCIGLYPAGAWVLLSRGMVALVREINYQQPTRPSVLLVYDTHNRIKLEPVVVDLTQTDIYGEVKKAVSPSEYRLKPADYLPLL